MSKIKYTVVNRRGFFLFEGTENDQVPPGPDLIHMFSVPNMKDIVVQACFNKHLDQWRLCDTDFLYKQAYNKGYYITYVTLIENTQ